MLDPDQIDNIKSMLGNVSDTLTQHGMKAFHESLAGRVRLLYSPTQHGDNRDIVANIAKSNNSGCIVALDIATGKVVRFTDIDVVEGNVARICYSLRPCDMDKRFHPERDKIYDDMEQVAEVDPRNLVTLQTVYGQEPLRTFEDPNPKNGSLVVYYGRERALEIVTMLRDLPAEVRLRGIYNGVDGLDSFDAVLEHKGNVTGFQRYRDRGRFGDCKP